MYYLIYLYLLLAYISQPSSWLAFKFGTDHIPTSRDLNRLIMDYLVIEGYKSAAEEFSQEANLTPPIDFESIESRMDIREALQRGDVEDAITRVNDLNPEVSNLLCLMGELLRAERIKSFSCTTLKTPSGCC
jgi:hypothetical protein